MAGRLGLHDIDANSVIVLGIPIKDGRADDNFVELDPQAQFEVIESADGLVIRCKTRKRRHPLMINLLQGSAEATKLAAIHAGDVATTGGSGVGPFLWEDGNGSTLVTGTCWIRKAPKRSLGNMQKVETWEFDFIADPETILYGGTDSPE